MPIEPINIPAAAGLDYASGDVRHFSQGDALNVPGLSGPSRYLAQRDNLLASKVNELVSAVNSTEQFVPLPVVRTVVPPTQQLVVLNYRIPVGFEARVLNAVVSTAPASTDVQLYVYYDSSFGGSTGVPVVTVAPGTEFTGSTNFSPAGEFVLVLANNGASTLEVAASVMLTMRPLGSTGALLAGQSVIVGPAGPPGQAGPPGPQGPAGSAGAATAGMNWTGPWTLGASYHVNDVASYSYTGTFGSWISTVAHVANSGNSPQVDSVTWNPVAVGSTGTTVVVQNITTSGSIPNYLTQTVYGTLVTGSDWANYPLNGYYNGVVAANSTVSNIPMFETSVVSAFANAGYGKGSAFLASTVSIYFIGDGTFTLPKQAYGAYTNYSNAYISAIAAVNGSLAFNHSGDGSVSSVLIQKVSTDSYALKNLNSAPVAVTVTFIGAQTA